MHAHCWVIVASTHTCTHTCTCMHARTMQAESHGGGVTAHGVGDEAGIAALIIIVQVMQLKHARGGAKGYLSAIVRGNDFTVMLPDHRGRRAAIEGTADGCRGTGRDIEVNRMHGELWSTFEKEGYTERGRNGMGKSKHQVTELSTIDDEDD